MGALDPLPGPAIGPCHWCNEIVYLHYLYGQYVCEDCSAYLRYVVATGGGIIVSGKVK
jgi:hypothetical protein